MGLGQSNNATPKIVKLAVSEQAPIGNSVAQLASLKYFIDFSSNLAELSEDFANDPAIPVVAVLSETNRVAGIITRARLFDLLKRPFGKDVLETEAVENVTEKCRVFRADTTLLAASEEIGSRTGPEQYYFPVEDAHGTYIGMFSLHELTARLTTILEKEMKLSGELCGKLNQDVTIDKSPLYSAASLHVASKSTSGDFLFLEKMPGSKLFAAIFTLKNPGLLAAAHGAFLAGALRFMLQQKPSQTLSEIIASLDYAYAAVFADGQGITASFLELHPKEGFLYLSDFGNANNFLWRDKKLLKMKTSDNHKVFGTRSKFEPEIFRYDVKASDIILSFSDGLFSSESAETNTHSLTRIKKNIELNGTRDIKELRSQLRAEIVGITASGVRTADASLYVLRIGQ